MLKRARSPSPDRNQMSDPEIPLEELNGEINEEDGGIDAMDMSLFDDEMTTFFVERLEKELTGGFWVLEDEADALYGVRKVWTAFKSRDFQLTYINSRSLLLNWIS